MKGIQYTPSRPCGEREGEVGRWKKEEGIESAKRNNGASWRVAEKEEALRRKISCFRTQQQTSFFNAKLLLPIFQSIASLRCQFNPNQRENPVKVRVSAQRELSESKGVFVRVRFCAVPRDRGNVGKPEDYL